MRKLSALVALVLLSLTSLPLATAPTRAAVPESHARLGELTWRTTGTNTATFHAVVSFRRSYYAPPPNVGETFDVGSEGAINYGDGGSSDSMYQVVAIDVTNDWFLATKDLPYTYATAGPWTASITGCCRLSGPQHINNPDESFRYEAIVDFPATTANPETSLPPIVDCPLNALCSFQIVAVDPAPQTLRFRFATPAEAGDSTFVQPGPPYAPNAATIGPTGQYTWNTTGATLNTSGSGDTYYSTQIMIEALNASNTVVTKSPVDFFIRLTTSTNHPPVFVSPPTPPDGTHFQIGVANSLNVTVQASDPDVSDMITLRVLNKPAGASFPSPAPANPVTTTLTWTPTAADVGQYVLNFTATDPHGAQALISISIDVVAGCAPCPTPSPAPATAMPTATSTPTRTATPTRCPVSFTDVHPADYFYTAVQYLACQGVISGYGDGTFHPYSQTTRGQLVKIIVLGFQITPAHTPVAGQQTFADVPPSFPFYPYIETAADRALISGYACGGPSEPCDPQGRPYFRPYANVTRGQLAKITVIGAGWAPPRPAYAAFADVPATSPFFPFVETAYCHAILSGYNCGGPGEPCDSQDRPYFRSGTNATRGQIAKIVYLAIQSPLGCTLPTPPPTHTPGPATRTPTSTATRPATASPAATRTAGATATRTATARPTATRTATARPSATRIPTPQATPTPGCTSYTASASVSNPSPAWNSNETVYGVFQHCGGGVTGATMHTTWYYRTTTVYCDGVTGPNGQASCTRNIGHASHGYPVVIDVLFTAPDGTQVDTTTSFTPP